jgi:hypothetical protein
MKFGHEFLDCLVEAITRNLDFGICADCWRLGHRMITQREEQQ